VCCPQASSRSLRFGLESEQKWASCAAYIQFEGRALEQRSNAIKDGGTRRELEQRAQQQAHDIVTNVFNSDSVALRDNTTAATHAIPSSHVRPTHCRPIVTARHVHARPHVQARAASISSMALNLNAHQSCCNVVGSTQQTKANQRQ
jgi:hypothetical protein